MERKSWAGARQACVDKEAALVSVQSREENDFLYGLLQKNTLKTFFSLKEIFKHS